MTQMYAYFRKSPNLTPYGIAVLFFVQYSSQTKICSQRHVAGFQIFFNLSSIKMLKFKAKFY